MSPTWKGSTLSAAAITYDYARRKCMLILSRNTLLCEPEIKMALNVTTKLKLY